MTFAMPNNEMLRHRLGFWRAPHRDHGGHGGRHL